MLRAEGIRAAYGTDEILHGVDIALHPGEAVALPTAAARPRCCGFWRAA